MKLTHDAEGGTGALPGTVYIVEDDDALSDALQFLLASRGLRARRFDSAEAFLDFVADQPLPPSAASCLLLDVRLQRISGVEVFDRLRQHELAHDMPTLFLTGHGNIGMAVEVLKKGAFDFFEKPFNDNRLVDRVMEALQQSGDRIRRSCHAAEHRLRLARLSQREHDVMAMVLSGKRNKLIADELGISMRTVEVHRSAVFAKMQVRNAVELARMLAVDDDPGQ